jgi:hypothetical protein
MVLAALAYILCRTLSVFFVYILPLVLAFDQMEHAYIIWGRVVASYTIRMSANVIPQVEPPRKLRALTVFVAFRLTSSRCSFHCSFESLVRPRCARCLGLHLALIGLDCPASIDACYATA